MELIILAILGGQILIVQFGGAVFRTVPLDFMTWMTIVVSTSFVLWIGELVPELKHNKEREEHSQPIGSHPPLFTVKPEEHF